jgi:ATP-binding cassette subfamily C protein
MEPEEINQQQIMISIEKSGLKKFIDSLSNGLDTIVGERGVKLSGGQKQRIGIARALYKNPTILFLDEGTSALDDKTEKGIIESIRLISNHKTIIMISHKLLTLKYCDKIYEINKNKIELVC